jgi:hypothetical protein
VTANHAKSLGFEDRTDWRKPPPAAVLMIGLRLDRLVGRNHKQLDRPKLEESMFVRSALLCLLVLLGSHPAASCPELHPITRKSLSGIWEGIEPLGLSVFLVEVGAGHRHSAVLVRDKRMVVFRLDEPKSTQKAMSP